MEEHIDINLVDKLDINELKKLHTCLVNINEHERTNRINEYVPYDWQKQFHNEGRNANQRLLLCAPQIGKSTAGSNELAYHLTGLYPEWWEGRRHKGPILGWACGRTNSKTRDSVQKYLFGDPYNPDALGTGAIPLSCIEKTFMKQGITLGFEAVIIKHHTDGVFDGYSRCNLKSYEMGIGVFTSEQVHEIWLDEEPPLDILVQCLKRQLNVDGTVFLTFTSEYGWTEVIDNFINNLQPGQSLVCATMDDAPHMTKEKQKQILDALPYYMREATRTGLPVMGEGLIFPIPDELIKIDPIVLPPHWFYMCGMDVGAWSSNTAGSWQAWCRETDTIYMYDEYKMRGGTPPIHAAAFNARGKDIRIIYPHDAEKTRSFDGMGTSKVVQMYRDLDCNMHYTHFTNPPADGEEEGKGGISADYGLYEMYDRMVTGRFKVFSTCKQWFAEKQGYHRKNGEIVRVNEDVISSSRYAALSIKRFGKQRAIMQRPRAQQQSNWFNPYDVNTWN